MAPGMIRRRSLCHPTMAALRRQPGVKAASGSKSHGRCGFVAPRERSPWLAVRGCAPDAALLKGAKIQEGHLVTQTILADFASQGAQSDAVSQAPRTAGERALDCLLAAGFVRTEPPNSASRGDLSRHVGRGSPAPPVPHCGRRGRGTLSASRIYDPRLSSLSCLRQGRQSRRVLLPWPGFPGPKGRRRRTHAERARELRSPRRGGRRRGGVLARHGGGDRGGGRRSHRAARRRQPVRRRAGTR